MIDDLLAAARSRLNRLGPADLAAVAARGGLVIDIRPEAQRRDDGVLPGAIVIDRNVLEWRLDPESPYRIPEARDGQQLVVIVCNEGFASSLAAATLQDIGVANATDLDGGFQAWLRHTATT